GRPRRIARTGRDALTASEQRIARLAVDGASNAEIAQELFVSLKTVETHLSSVYRKLGLAGHGSRERLTQALATPATTASRSRTARAPAAPARPATDPPGR
ncbi:MAG TPA: helix-turn-helix transcriptional regulator, partial [Baekduia sp.]|nr:helix-turn-helix transcriptional regulator [Baekduia sp.]